MYAPGLRQSKRILNKFSNTKPQIQPFPLPLKHVNESDDEDNYIKEIKNKISIENSKILCTIFTCMLRRATSYRLKHPLKNINEMFGCLEIPLFINKFHEIINSKKTESIDKILVQTKRYLILYFFVLLSHIKIKLMTNPYTNPNQ